MNKKLLSMLLLIITLITTITNINFTKSNTNLKNTSSTDRHIKVRPETFMSLKSTDQTKVYLDKTFADPNLITNLKIELKSIINQDDQGYFMYQYDVENVTSLDLIGDKIKTTQGLEIFINLIDLNLTNNYDINNLTYLSKLIYLKNLDLESCEIKNLSFIKPLVNLVKLDLNTSVLKDITPLENLVNLEELNLESNFVKSFKPIGKLKNLKMLDLQTTSLSNISFLTLLPKLTNLDLSHNKIDDISFLNSLNYLQNLNLSANKVKNINAIKNLKNLVNLDLSYNYIANTNEAWAPIHDLPNYRSSWDDINVRYSQNV